MKKRLIKKIEGGNKQICKHSSRNTFVYKTGKVKTEVAQRNSVKIKLLFHFSASDNQLILLARKKKQTILMQENAEMSLCFHPLIKKYNQNYETMHLDFMILGIY